MIAVWNFTMLFFSYSLLFQQIDENCKFVDSTRECVFWRIKVIWSFEFTSPWNSPSCQTLPKSEIQICYLRQDTILLYQKWGTPLWSESFIINLIHFYNISSNFTFAEFRLILWSIYGGTNNNIIIIIYVMINHMIGQNSDNVKFEDTRW